MLHKIIKYEDYNGEQREEEFLFNLKNSEVLELELSIDGGIKSYIEKIVERRSMPELSALFKKIILMSYGEKSADGRRFIKSEELSKEFEQTEAYSVLIMELLTDEKAAADFMNAIIPKNGDNKDQATIIPAK